MLCEANYEGFAGFHGEGDLVGVAGGDWFGVGWGDGGDCLAAGGSYAVGVVAGGFEDGFGGFAILPGEIDLEAASGAEAAKGSGGPRGGQGREEPDYVEVWFGAVGVGLEKHLDEASGAAEVAVDLEGVFVPGAADVEQVGAGGLAEELKDALVGGVAVFEAGHAVDDPGAGPAGAASVGG